MLFLPLIMQLPRVEDRKSSWGDNGGVGEVEPPPSCARWIGGRSRWTYIGSCGKNVAPTLMMTMMIMTETMIYQQEQRIAIWAGSPWRHDRDQTAVGPQRTPPSPPPYTDA